MGRKKKTPIVKQLDEESKQHRFDYLLHTVLEEMESNGFSREEDVAVARANASTKYSRFN